MYYLLEVEDTLLSSKSKNFSYKLATLCIVLAIKSALLRKVTAAARFWSSRYKQEFATNFHSPSIDKIAPFISLVLIFNNP